MKQKHKITALLTAFCLLLSMLPISSLTAQAAGGVLTGSGTQQSPYQIEDAADLRAFANLVNNGGGTYAWGELTADIDLNPGYTFHEDGSWSYSGMEENPGEPAGWAPIGKANTSYYRGTFEGNGHTVSGIYVTGEQYAGMFGYVFIGTVQNLNVKNSYIHAEYNGLGRAGGIAAAVGAPASSASLQNCTSSAFVSASILWGSAGGIAGDAGVNANVSNCYATGSVTGIRNSSESFSDVNVGGVVGDLSGTLSNSYATGSVTVTAINDSSNSNVFAGGVVGYIEGNSIRLSNSYALAGNGASQTIGHIGVGNTTVTNVELRSADQMQSSEFAETLNNGQRPAAWRSDYKSISINNGYPVLAYQVPFEGSGTEDDPYLIATLEELIDFRDIVNTGSTDVCARLIADIDLNPDFTISSDEGYTGSGTPEQWTPIGSSYDYSGVFDGDGHTITGLYININTTSYDGGYYGLFGRVNGGTVRDINLTNSYLSVTCNGYIWIGSIVGSMSNGTISGCTSDAAVSAAVGASEVYAGGIVGNVSGLDVASTVENCGNTGTVSASSWQYSYVGGVVGRTDFTAPTICGTVSGCYNTGNVTATTTSVPSYPYAGGVVGNNSGDLINCYNTGAVSANANGPVPANAYAYAGGVAGRHDGNNDPVLSYSYNTGSVTAVSTGTTYIGGVVGRNMDTVTDVYYLTGTANVGIGNAASNPSGVWPRAEDEMKEAAMVTSLNRDQSPAPWQMDHTIDGEQVNGGYPILFWQGVFNGGVGTQEEPYLIATKEQLEAFRDLVNSGRSSTICGKLTADIDLNPGFTFREDGSYTGSGTPEQWTPIVDSSNLNYGGSFDGDGHVIRGLYINGVTLDYAGLFGSLPSSNGYIRNLGLENSYISSSSRHAGGIVGSNTGRVENCYSTAMVNSSSFYTSVGGVVGSSSGTVQNCFSTGPVSWTYQGQGEAYLGGVVGSNSGTVQNCFSTSTVSASAATAYIGAVAGQSSSNVQNCYYLEGSAQTGVGRTPGGGTVTAVESRTVEQMVGPDALTNMFELGSGWVTGTGLSDWTYQGTNAAADPPYALYARTGQLPRQSVFSEHQTLSITTTNMVVSSDGYYLIYNADQLATFRNIANNTLTEEEIASGYTANAAANGRLMADIDLNPGYTFHEDGTYTYSGEGDAPGVQNWDPIGNSSRHYSGTFDGNSKTVSGIYINTSSDSQGMFGYIENGTVQNLGLENGYIHGNNNTAAFAGTNRSGSVQNCFTTLAVNGLGAVGGIVGANYGSVANCYNTGSITGSGVHVGGIVGYSERVDINNCYNTGTVSGNISGGIAGNVNGGSVTNCYYLSTSSEEGISDGDGEAVSVTIAEIEDTSDNGLLARIVSRSDSGVWNATLSAVANWEYGKPAVQPVLSWQQAIENAPVYTVTIPEKAAAGGDAVNVTMYAGALRTEQQVEVRVAEDNDFNLYYGGDKNGDSIKYNAYINGGGTALTSGALVLSGGNMQSSASPASASLTFTATGTPKFSGDYTGNITFTVSVENAA